MGLFSKKPKEQKVEKGNYFTGERLNDKTAQKLIKRAAVLQAVPSPDNVRSVLAAVAFPTTANYALCTEKELVYITTNNVTFRANRFPLSSITSVYTVENGFASASIFFSTGGAGTVELEVPAALQDTNKFFEYLQSVTQKAAVTNNSSETSLSSADEIKKFKDLLDTGAITQEEFDQKKKQLLGL